MKLASQPGRSIPALWASTTPRNETDAVVRFFTAEGGLFASAKGLLKPASKLAPVLKPGDELALQLAWGRTPMPVLVGATRVRPHPAWQRNLNYSALCWFITECACVSEGDDELNAALYQLTVNLLRSEPAPEHLQAAAVVFCLRLLSLHGVMLSLTRCALSGEALADGELVHMLPKGEGVVGRDAYNKNYARTGGGMPRLDAERRRRWRELARLPLLEYASVVVDAMDCALLVHLVEQQVAAPAAQYLGSSVFLKQQWKLPAWPELCQGEVHN